MRLTESQLRRLVGKIISEMPYAGSLGVRHTPDPDYIPAGMYPPSTFFDPTTQDELDSQRGSAERLAKSEWFGKEAERRYSYLPFPVWTAAEIGVPRDGKDERADVMDLFPDGVDLLGQEGFSFEGVGKGDLVLMYSAAGVMKGFNASPWMIIHTFFDDPDSFRTGMLKLVPSYSDMRVGAPDSGSVIMIKPDGMFAGLTRLRDWIEDDNHPLWQLFYETSSRAGAFTFGSANRLLGIAPIANDLAAEIICQELLDKRRFHMNLDVLPAEQAALFPLLKRWAVQCASEFRANAPGKLIRVSVN